MKAFTMAIVICPKGGKVWLNRMRKLAVGSTPPPTTPEGSHSTSCRLRQRVEGVEWRYYVKVMKKVD